MEFDNLKSTPDDQTENHPNNPLGETRPLLQAFSREWENVLAIGLCTTFIAGTSACGVSVWPMIDHENLSLYADLGTKVTIGSAIGLSLLYLRPLVGRIYLWFNE